MSVARGLEKIEKRALLFPQGFPSGYSQGNRYHREDNVGWTPGFWAGLLWLAHQQTGERIWRERAEALIPSFAERLDAGGAGVETHDLGFLYTLSCVASWKMTGDAAAKALALRAADLLARRYWIGGRVIQAWGRLDDEVERGRIIIDSTMNMPLLLWAARECDRGSFGDMAVHHLDQCARYLVRPDGSTFHTYFVDVHTGNGRYGTTSQGFSDDSCWSRGQAWGIYGFALAYRYTREVRFLEVAERLARYFLSRLPPDNVCYWDLAFDEKDRQERDTSAAAIAASGLLELHEHVAHDDAFRARVREAALHILETLTSQHVSTDPDQDGILLHAVAHRPLRQGVNECCLWGDYFYVEAMVRQFQGWMSFW